MLNLAYSQEKNREPTILLEKLASYLPYKWTYFASFRRDRQEQAKYSIKLHRLV